MVPANTVIPGEYDYGEVMRSILIAIAASGVALDLTGRVTAAKGRARPAWLGGGAVVMGIGIWEMHLKGMLAFRLRIPVAYHLPTVLASLVIAILASAIALFIASRHKMGFVEALTGSILMGSGIAGLHYTFMAAMRMPAIIHYSLPVVALSILLAVLFSLIALLMAFGLRDETMWVLPWGLSSAVVMGIAISAMHYTAMAAATFISSSPPDLSHCINISPLGNSAVATVTMIVLLAAVITSSLDRRAQTEMRRINQDLEARIDERTHALAGANTELIKLRDDLRLVVDTIPQQIWSGPPDGTLDYCNQRWRSETGLTLEEIQGEGWQRMLHPEDRERVLEAWRESVAHGTPYEQEERHRGADGTYRWFLGRGVPLRDGSGNIVRWYGTNTDIEDWKRAQQALLESRSDLQKAFEKIKNLQDQLRVVIDTIPAMVWSKLPDGSADFLNRRFLEYSGLALDEGLGEGWKSIIHPADRPRFDDKWSASLAEGKPFEIQARLRQADGQYRAFLLRAVPLYDERGNIIRWYGTSTDIEDRERAENELRKQKEILQKIFEQIPAMIAFVGKDRRIELANPQWERTLGWSLDELQSQNVDLLAETCPDPQYRQMVRDFVSASTGEWTDLTIRVRDGRMIDLTVAVQHLSDGPSLVIAQDITDRRRTEAALQEAQAQLAHITRVVALGEVAHEINQPLAAIVTNANFCLRSLAVARPDLDSIREAIAEIANDGTRASAIISRIRGLLQKGAPERIELDLNQISREVITLLRGELTRNRVSVRAQLAADLPRVSGDPVQMQQVLINLLMNGVDAMRSLTSRPRELILSTLKNQGDIIVQVRDSGEGLDPQQAERIFQPFFTTKSEGTGLGLAISRSIIESHGGRLWAESTSKGALFQFTLPVS